MTPRLNLTRVLILPLLLLALFADPVHTDDMLWETLLEGGGLILLLAATGGRIWASVHLVGRKNQTLVTTGPFSVSRNPLYLFSLFGFVGAGLVFGSVTLAALMGLVFFLSHWPTILREERELETLFGDEYREYRERVPRLLPKLGGVESGGTIPLDTRRFSIALRDCLAIPLIIPLADLVEWAQVSGVLPVLLELP